MRSYFGEVIAEGIDVGLVWGGNLTQADQFFLHPLQIRTSDDEDDPGYSGWIFYCANTKDIGGKVILKLPVNYRYSLVGKRGGEILTADTSKSRSRESSEFTPRDFTEDEKIDVRRMMKRGLVRISEDDKNLEYRDASGNWHTVTERAHLFPEKGTSENDIDGLDAWATEVWESEKAGLLPRSKEFPGAAPLHVYWVHESCVPVAVRGIIHRTPYRIPCVRSEAELEELKEVFIKFDKHSGCSTALERPVTRAEASKFFDRKAIEYGMSQPYKVTEGGEALYSESPTRYSLVQLYEIWDAIQSEMDAGPDLIYAQRCFVQLLAGRYVSIGWVGRASISYIEDGNHQLHPDEKDAVFVYVLWNLQEQCRKELLHSEGRTIFGEDQLVSDCIRKKFYALVGAHEKQHRKKGRVTTWTPEQLKRLG